MRLMPMESAQLCFAWKIPNLFSESNDTKAESAAKFGRHGQRDATLILVAFRHGLRPVEIADLEWSQVERGRNPALHVRRAKNGKPAVHPIPATNCACCASCSVEPARNCGRSGKLTVVCREYVAWSRRHWIADVETTRKNIATYAT
jgi:hypothetical protein